MVTEHRRFSEQGTITVAAVNTVDKSGARYICDGVDDQVEIQAAIDACAALGPANGGSVLLLDGNYSISATINLSQRVPLIGSGWGTIITLANGSDCYMLSSVNQIQTTIVRDLELDGNAANQAAGGGIYWEGGFLMQLENLRIRSCKVHGLLTVEGVGWNNALYCCNVVVGECLGYGIHLTTAHSATFINCVSESNVGTGWRISGGERITFINCWGEGNTVYDIQITDCGIISVLGGIFDAPTNTIWADNTVGTVVLIGVQLNRATSIDPAVKLFAAGNTGVGAINSQQRHADLFMDVLGITANHVVNNENLAAGLPITFTIVAQPDVPRTLSGHFDSHAQITAYTIVITGVNAKGQTVVETFTEAASPWDFETSNAFATVTSIIMTARTGTGAGDTMDIGITDILGLSNPIDVVGDVYKIKKNNANAVVAAAQVSVAYDTYDMAVIGLVVGDDFTIWYKSNMNVVA